MFPFDTNYARLQVVSSLLPPWSYRHCEALGIGRLGASISDSPSELGKFAFELGKVLLKVELCKRASAKLVRSLGGTEKESVLVQKIGKYWNQQDVFDRPDGLIIITNYRLIFLSTVKTMLTRTDFLSFPFSSSKTFKQPR
jgi:hypothetical protein